MTEEEQKKLITVLQSLGISSGALADAISEINEASELLRDLLKDGS